MKRIAWQELIDMQRLSEDLHPTGGKRIGVYGHVVTYPLRGEAISNFVGDPEDKKWWDVSWSTKGTYTY